MSARMRKCLFCRGVRGKGEWSPGEVATGVPLAEGRGSGTDNKQYAAKKEGQGRGALDRVNAGTRMQQAFGPPSPSHRRGWRGTTLGTGEGLGCGCWVWVWEALSAG